ncbi:MAG: hypothetical protein ETSY2_21750 [Candidatus Entotheonella gemina]|uniref:Uncharacterized protein n=1 Tax=Candidatus Entotheonella gemina TaxID=1429439 RepID=W4M5M1_9BACT|nr:MAG: hypothetical protein ETSY2_21750 [Candidatus Entotheonella gemina]
MAWQDPIVEEVRKARDAYAKKFNYDLDAIFRDLKAKEHQSGRQVVQRPSKQTKTHDQNATVKPG